MRSLTAIAIILAAASASAIEIKEQRIRIDPPRIALPPPSPIPPMPVAPAVSDVEADQPEPAKPADPRSAYAQILARQQDRAIHTQRTARVKGEILSRIDTDAKGAQTAKIIRPDGLIESRPIKMLHTARLKPPAPESPPIDGSHAAAAAAGALAAAAAATAIAKAKGPKQTQPKGIP